MLPSWWASRQERKVCTLLSGQLPCHQEVRVVPPQLLQASLYQQLEQSRALQEGGQAPTIQLAPTQEVEEASSG